MSFRLEMPMPDDWHVHLRDGFIRDRVSAFSGIQFHNNLVMPNLVPPVLTKDDIVAYHEHLIGGSRFLDSLPTRMTLYLNRQTTPEIIADAKLYALAAKYYPHGGTTNSGSGLSSPRDLADGVLRMMEELNMVLCLHAEVTRDQQADELLRERDFIPHLDWLVHAYPSLRIVVEHVSDRRMLDYVFELPATVAATITAHHPFITLDDAKYDPHCHCMPIAKTPKDRDYLAQRILEADELPKIFFGSDSAPHPIENKQGGAAGVWSSPVAIPVLWDYFDTSGRATKWDAFLAFMCENGSRFYDVGPSLERRPKIVLRREAWRVPEEFSGMRPWRAGELLQWQVEGMEWFTERGGPVD